MVKGSPFCDLLYVFNFIYCSINLEIKCILSFSFNRLSLLNRVAIPSSLSLCPPSLVSLQQWARSKTTTQMAVRKPAWMRPIQKPAVPTAPALIALLTWASRSEGPGAASQTSCCHVWATQWVSETCGASLISA